MLSPPQRIPPIPIFPTDYKIPTDADYFHITTNNTIYGTEIKEDMDVSGNPGGRYVI